MLRRLFLDNWTLKVLSAALAVILYVYVQSEREVTTTVTPRLVLQVPEGLLHVGAAPDRVKVVVAGPWSVASALEPEEVPPVMVDLSGFGEGPITYYLDEDLIRLPAGLRITSITPAALTLDLEPRIVRSVAVAPDLRGEPGYGHGLGPARVRPPEVELTGPRSAVEAVRQVSTEPVDVSGATEDVRRTVRVVTPHPQVSRVTREPVEVTVPVQAQRLERTVRRIPVRTPEGFEGRVRPKTVDLDLVGPLHVLEPLQADALTVRVEAEDLPGPGERREVVVEAELPVGVELVGEAPSVEVRRTSVVQGG